MKRVLVVYNPRSTQAERVEREVLGVLERRGGDLGKYEVLDTDVDDNARKLAKVVRDGDLVLTAGGDAAAVIGLNGVMLSGKDAVFVALPYGNFNDTARSLGVRGVKDVLQGQALQAGARFSSRRAGPGLATREVWPLEMVIDGKHFRYDLNYFTVGMFAEAAAIFDEPGKRKRLQSGRKGRMVFSLFALARWWWGHRREEFIEKGMTDFVAVNGVSMAKVMRGGKYFFGKKFVRATGNLSGFLGLLRVMVPSVIARVPGREVGEATLELGEKKEVMVQGGGEYKRVWAKKIVIRKEKCVKVMMRK